ncbi:MAG: PEP-CTERM sorting domain-containing protein [Thermoguttaceae bacterium]
MTFTKVCFSVLALATLLLAGSAQCGTITPINVVTSNGYQFTNFDGPTPNAAGTTIDGISNIGTVVGFTSPDDVSFNNFTANPLLSTSAANVQVNGSTTAFANGINSSGTVVGTDGNGNAFSLIGTHVTTFIPDGGTAAVAFGVNDSGAIVGQYSTSAAQPGFILSGSSLTTINAPAGVNTVFAQGINNNGLVVGFYVGADGNDHGLTFSASSAVNHVGTGTAIADPTIPQIPAEPGATFVFSQILGINDNGLAVGYYGDSTGSQHGFLYNTISQHYSFLDDPNAAFDNGVEITQITGINNQGEITGFYTDANGLPHGFVATVVPEPGTLLLLLAGAVLMAFCRKRR